MAGVGIVHLINGAGVGGLCHRRNERKVRGVVPSVAYPPLLLRETKEGEEDPVESV